MARVEIVEHEYRAVNTGLVDYSTENLSTRPVFAILQDPATTQPADDAAPTFVVASREGLLSTAPGLADKKLWFKAGAGSGTVYIGVEEA